MAYENKPLTKNMVDEVLSIIGDNAQYGHPSSFRQIAKHAAMSPENISKSIQLLVKQRKIEEVAPGFYELSE